MDVIHLMHVLWKFQALLSLSLLLIGDGGCKTAPASAVNSTSSYSILTDAQALLEFKQSVNDPEGVLKEWVANASKTPGEIDSAVCGWRGVRCASSRVSELNLSGALLSGRLPEPALSKLDHLQNLSLGGNSFDGSFNGSFLTGSGPNCTMRFVDLSSNELSGSISLTYLSSCNSLRLLNLSGNVITSLLDPDSSMTVQALDLSHNNLTGQLNPKLFADCGSLQMLNLSHNQLNGSIPIEIGSCATLQHLILSSNRLSGELPFNFSMVPNGSEHTQTPPGEYLANSNLQVKDISFNSNNGQLGQVDCKVLMSLDLSWNNFSGEVPAALSQCDSLEFINLSGNRLSGLIPGSLGNLRSLRSFNLSYNNLSGVIPPELALTCATLQTFDLSNNSLSGSIPVNFSACTLLEYFCLSSNNLSGEFPDMLGQMHSLQIMRIYDNYIEGPMPSHVDNCTDLEVLDLSSNLFSGGIPTQEFCGVNSALRSLFLTNNRFTGPVPSSLTNCTHLQILDLSFNSFTGKFPPELCTFLHLEHLMIWYNKLEGGIPSDIGSCTKLKTLIMNYNNLQGFIPAQLSNCSELTWLSLTSNQFSGPIPPEFGLLTKLAILQLSNNSLTGHIPLELENCSSLVWLDLNSNHLDGMIPPRIGRKVISPLMHGTFTNSIMGFARNVDDQCKGVGGLLEIGGIRWKQLSQSPMLSSCKYRFYKGVNYSADQKVSTLVFLDLSYNDLSGNLPKEIGGMTDLIILDVSHNSLNGSIPPSIGQLKNLELLHLAWNQLQGKIPYSLPYLTFLADLNLSHNHLSGPIPQAGQLTTFPASAYAINDGLCDLPLPPCSSQPPANILHAPGPVAHRKKGDLPRISLIILVLSLILTSLIGIVLWWIWHQKKFKQEFTPPDSIFPFDQNWKITAYREPLSINVATFERPLRRITFTDLVEATKGFDVKNMVGSGGFGEVYKAHLADGSIVAVKKLTRFNYQGERQFVSEMETLGKIKHPNLVPLLGYCKIGEERILVYEYMPSGNLEHLLYETYLVGARITIIWELRKHIALGMARGLAFLHHQCIPHVIHRDMKSSNVLLDTCFEARLSDFGMARLISASDTHNSVSSLAGTPGYVPPEYYQSCRCTKEGDVYSFGVVLLEILTRRKPTDKEEFGDNNLVGWVKLHVNKNRSIEVLDPDLIEQKQEQEEMLDYLNVACKCLEDQPSLRPSMLQVVAMFKELSLD